MHNYIFYVSRNKLLFNTNFSKIILQASDFCESATIKDITGDVDWVIQLCTDAPMETDPPCGQRFRFDEPFSPWHLSRALIWLCKHRYCYCEFDIYLNGEMRRMYPAVC